MELNEKKIKIMEVAEDLFAINGFSGTSVREIAKLADVNVAMINYYFESKDKLFESIFRYRGDYLRTRIETLINDTSITNWQKIDFFIDEYIERFSDNHKLHRILIREHGLTNNEGIRNFINEAKYRNYQTITNFVKRGQEQGDFNTEVDMMMLYTMIPGITKFMLFNEDFLRFTLNRDHGYEPTHDEFKKRNKDFLKNAFRLILEKK
ncbi:TetR/AcrR family transcriptional regulator [Robertkochia solimangrovi]|uniref:TetR/AcrR family transcriptional regulator n=1 Tax=Robertkochia solimangrovi TaxID=2213046 RepID=UPI00117C1A0E|nr:TetR family transcriptional regulator [Robertkochia solimangrovi]TRZ45895.1 TetR/AcrR family transcriptional regulator [Robertkochia solimangrovi]